jgi:hypothetical protein
MKEIYMRCLWFILEFNVEDVYNPEGALRKAMYKALDLQCEVFEEHLPHESPEGYKMAPLLIASTFRETAVLCSQEIKTYLNIHHCEAIAPLSIARTFSSLSEHFEPDQIGSTGGFYLYSNLANISRHNLKLKAELEGNSA